MTARKPRLSGRVVGNGCSRAGSALAGGWREFRRPPAEPGARACAAAGVQRVKLYEGTKHSRATDLLRQGVPERVIQALLGHDDARSTRRYARLADSALVAVIRPRGE